MKKTFLVLLFFTMGVSAAWARLTVNVSNIDHDAGEVRVLLCDEASFLTPNCAMTKSQPAAFGTLSFVFEDVPAGNWALLAYHDANSNHDLDRNFLGIPTEQFGFSNNPGYTHKPKFAESTVAISDQDVALSIVLSDK